MEKIRLDGETMTRGQFVYRYAYCDDWFNVAWSTSYDQQDHWSPDLAGRADEWAAWQEEVELRAVMEAELAEYQQQMEAAYVRRLYEEQEALEWRRQQWSPVNDGARW